PHAPAPFAHAAVKNHIPALVREDMLEIQVLPGLGARHDEEQVCHDRLRRTPAADFLSMLAGFVRQEGNSSTFVRIIPIEGGSRRAVRTCGTWANPQNEPPSRWGKAMTRLVRMARLLVAFYLLSRHEMTDNDGRLCHPWLRINRVLRVMPQTRWSAEAWPQVKAEFTKALALRSQIRRADGSTDRVEVMRGY